MEIRLNIDGMTCGGCKAAVERVLAAQPGVISASVDLMAGQAMVSVGDGRAAETLVAAIEDAGYDARIDG